MTKWPNHGLTYQRPGSGALQMFIFTYFLCKNHTSIWYLSCLFSEIFCITLSCFRFACILSRISKNRVDWNIILKIHIHIPNNQNFNSILIQIRIVCFEMYSISLFMKWNSSRKNIFNGIWNDKMSLEIFCLILGINLWNITVFVMHVLSDCNKHHD